MSALDLSGGCGRFDQGFQDVTSPGWFCCQCRIFNGFQRYRCKSCRHPSCFKADPDQQFFIHVRTPGGGISNDFISQAEREALIPTEHGEESPEEKR